VSFESRTTTPHTIYGGRLTVATRAPCTNGAEAASIEVDNGAVPHGALPAGAHELRARFEQSARDFELDLVFDLELEGGACARVPVVSQSLPMVPTKRFVLVASFDLAATPDLSGLRGLVHGTVGGGGWLGPVLLTGEAGVGSATCVASLCGRDAMGQFRSGLSIPGSVDVRYAVGSRNVGMLLGVFLVGARYSLATVNLPTIAEGERSFVTHSAHAVVSYGMGDAVRARSAGSSGWPSWKACCWSRRGRADAPQQHVGFSGGIGFRFLLPVM
jgi:hypothetical protein